tara:strand:+ start:4816 stop:5847 length:1032 start_codon:yes stop_codon:yes gene_type:complete
MANWKKIIVSGSNAHLAAIKSSTLTNDEILIAGTDGLIENSGISFNGTLLNIGASSITSTGASTVLTGSFTGSFSGDGSGLTGLPTALAFADTDSGTDTLNLLGDTLTFAGGTSITSVVTNNQVSFGVDNGGITETQLNTSVAGTGLSGGGGTALSVDYGSGAGTAVQGNVNFSLSGTSGEIGVTGTTAQALGSGPSYTLTLPDTISGNRTFSGTVNVGTDLVVTGDLTINGTTTTLNTSNLLVEDRFILLNSGSANPDEGGLIIDEGTGTGHAFIYDAGDTRWGFNASVAQDATTANTTAYAAAIVDLDNSAHSTAYGTTPAEYDKRGNIKIDTSDDIWIYA